MRNIILLTPEMAAFKSSFSGGVHNLGGDELLDKNSFIFFYESVRFCSVLASEIFLRSLECGVSTHCFIIWVGIKKCSCIVRFLSSRFS